MTLLAVHDGWSPVLAVLGALVAGAAVGLLHGAIADEAEWGVPTG
jgi:D-xylose transport system permease protein